MDVEADAATARARPRSARVPPTATCRSRAATARTRESVAPERPSAPSQATPPAPCRKKSGRARAGLLDLERSAGPSRASSMRELAARVIARPPSAAGCGRPASRAAPRAAASATSGPRSRSKMCRSFGRMCSPASLVARFTRSAGAEPIWQPSSTCPTRSVLTAPRSAGAPSRASRRGCSPRSRAASSVLSIAHVLRRVAELGDDARAQRRLAAVARRLGRARDTGGDTC